MKRMDCLAPLYNAGLMPFCFRKQYQQQKHKDKGKKSDYAHVIPCQCIYGLNGYRNVVS